MHISDYFAYNQYLIPEIAVKIFSWFSQLHISAWYTGFLDMYEAVNKELVVQE